MIAFKGNYKAVSSKEKYFLHGCLAALSMDACFNDIELKESIKNQALSVCDAQQKLGMEIHWDHLQCNQILSGNSIYPLSFAYEANPMHIGRTLGHLLRGIFLR